MSSNEWIFLLQGGIISHNANFYQYTFWIYTDIFANIVDIFGGKWIYILYIVVFIVQMKYCINTYLKCKKNKYTYLIYKKNKYIANRYF